MKGGGTEEAVEGVTEQGVLGVGVERRETILGALGGDVGQPSPGDAGRHDPLILPGERGAVLLEGGHGINQAGVEVTLEAVGQLCSGRRAVGMACAHLVVPVGRRTRATRRAAPSAATRSDAVPSSLTLVVIPPAPAAGARSSTTPVPRRSESLTVGTGPVGAETTAT